MKMTKFIGVFTLVLILAFAMAACGGSSSGGGKSALAGKWCLIEGESSTSSPKDVELLNDGTGFTLGQAITWKTEKDRIYLTHPNLAMVYSYKVSGSRLDLTNDRGEEFVYMKLGGTSAIVGTWESNMDYYVPKKDFTFYKDGVRVQEGPDNDEWEMFGREYHEMKWVTDNDLLYIINEDTWSSSRVQRYGFKIKGDILALSGRLFWIDDVGWVDFGSVDDDGFFNFDDYNYVNEFKKK